jgi:hypothetical protein
MTRASTTQATAIHRITFNGTRSTPNKRAEREGSLTFAGADEEVPVGRDGAVEEVHHGPRVAVAHQRDGHLLLLHRFDPAPLLLPSVPSARTDDVQPQNAAPPERNLTLAQIEESENKIEERRSARSGSVGLDLY